MANYIKFDGIDGEVLEHGHEKWTELASFSNSAHKGGSGGTGTTRVQGVTIFEDIGASKNSDKTTPKLLKAMILMTDGMFNKEYESGNGKSADQALKLCANMKAKGIAVYTIGFQAPADALAILAACASSPSHFFDANDGAQLNATFKDIANRLTSLRISG